MKMKIKLSKKQINIIKAINTIEELTKIKAPMVFGADPTLEPITAGIQQTLMFLQNSIFEKEKENE